VDYSSTQSPSLLLYHASLRPIPIALKDSIPKGIYSKRTNALNFKDFLISKVPMITENRQIQAMEGNLQGSGLKTIVSGPFEPTFNKNVNLEELLIYF
jgi:hypothetical protein